MEQRRYDLKKMLEEIKIDGGGREKKVLQASQDDIKQMLEKRKNKRSGK